MMGKNPTVVFPKPFEVVIEEREIPVPQKGELLIRTLASMVSIGTELTFLSNEFEQGSMWSNFIKYPFVPGYDNVGEVIDVGSEVDPSWVGKRVAAFGCHAAYITAPADEVRIVHRNITNEQAAFSTIAEIVINGVRHANIELGQAVGVYGLGPLGQLTVRFCQMNGAHPVFAIGMSDKRHKYLPKSTAIIPVNYNKGDMVDVVKDATCGRMCDTIFEVTGNADFIPQQFSILKKQGKMILLGSPKKKTSIDLHDLCNSPSYSIIGVHIESHPAFETPYNPWTKKRNAEYFFNMVADGMLDVDSLISHKCSFEKAPEIYKMLLEDRSQAMGIIYNWT
ncbi:MAG TPA: zinc-binding dehydrogenase [Ruminiclostridium sp.]